MVRMFEEKCVIECEFVVKSVMNIKLFIMSFFLLLFSLSFGTSRFVVVMRWFDIVVVLLMCLLFVDIMNVDDVDNDIMGMKILIVCKFCFGLGMSFLFKTFGVVVEDLAEDVE